MAVFVYSEGGGRTAGATWRHWHRHWGRGAIAWTDFSCLSLCPASRFDICTQPSLSKTTSFHFWSAPENHHAAWSAQDVPQSPKSVWQTSKLAVTTHYDVCLLWAKNGLVPYCGSTMVFRYGACKNCWTFVCFKRRNKYSSNHTVKCFYTDFVTGFCRSRSLFSPNMFPSICGERLHFSFDVFQKTVTQYTMSVEQKLC